MIYHFLYQTECLTTGRIYVGRHSTSNLEDGYLGSGVQITRSIKKHGKGSHKRTIIAFASSHEELVQLEQLYVNEEFIKRPDVMNLTTGGHSDFSHVSDELRSAVCAANGAKNGPKNVAHTHTPSAREKAKATMLQRYGKLSTYDGAKHVGRKASPETIQKLSEAAIKREAQKKLEKQNDK